MALRRMSACIPSVSAKPKCSSPPISFRIVANSARAPALTVYAPFIRGMASASPVSERAVQRKPKPLDETTARPPTYELIDIDVDEFDYRSSCLLDEVEDALHEFFQEFKSGDAQNFHIRRGRDMLHVHLGPHGNFEIERSVPGTVLHLRANTVNHKDTRKYKFDPIGREWVQIQVDGDANVLASSEPLLNFMLKNLLKNVRETGGSKLK